MSKYSESGVDLPKIMSFYLYHTVMHAGMILPQTLYDRALL